MKEEELVYKIWNSYMLFQMTQCRQRELTILVSVFTDNPIQIIRYVLGCCYNGWPMRVLESGFQSERTVVTTIVLWINLGN